MHTETTLADGLPELFWKVYEKLFLFECSVIWYTCRGLYKAIIWLKDH